MAHTTLLCNLFNVEKFLVCGTLVSFIMKTYVSCAQGALKGAEQNKQSAR